VTRPTATDLVVDALAVARIVRLVQVDEIPLGDVREILLNLGGEAKWTELFRCVWCGSIWVGFGVVLARHLFPRTWPWIARALASSAVAGHLAELSG
jgi:hypothetical protein